MNTSSAPTYSFTPGALALVGEARLAYIRQVYTYFSLGILGGIVGALLGMGTPFGQAIMANRFIGIIAFFATFWFAQRSAANPTRALPTMMLFTVVSGLFLSPVLYMYAHGFIPGSGPQTIFNALALTGAVFASLTAYTYISKKDFSYMAASLTIGLVLLIVASILGIFFGSATTDLAIAVIGVIIFSGFVLVDTSLILRQPMQVPPTSAALRLYLDFLNIFLFLLQILGGGSRRR